jgi:hypothetical protein
MKFIKTYEGYFNPNTGKIIDTGDFIIPLDGTTLQANEPENTISNDKLKFTKASTVESPTPPNWVKNPNVWAADELVPLLEKYLSVFASIYAKCFSERYAGPNAVVEVKGRLETLLRELKTKDPLRIEDAVRVFFDNVSPKLSERNVSSWLQSSDGRKWGESIIRFENLCFHILS